MPQKLAIKRLTALDLSFFRWQYRNNPSSKQKAINLNADVFVDELYPGLKDVVQDRFLVDVFIYGPGLAGEYNILRKIVKTAYAKNWRLNGEIIANPEDNPSRFDTLVNNDFAIFKFNEGVVPSSAKLVFIAAAVPEDKNIHDALDQLLDGTSMVAVPNATLEGLAKDVDLVPEHPLYELTLDTTTLNPDVEDIALGGSQGKTRLTSWSSRRKISRADLQKAKESADFVGLQGEQYVNDYLSKLKVAGKIRDFEWIADKNAISPYDFWIGYDGSTKVLIDVKSTQGDFERTLHVSLNELLRMSEGPERYDIYRIFDMNNSTAQLSIAEDVGSLAKQVLQVLSGLPQGISSDSISFSPTILPFDQSQALMIEEQTEE